MKSNRMFTSKRIGIILPALGLGAIVFGSLQTTPSWAQANADAASISAPADAQTASAGVGGPIAGVTEGAPSLPIGRQQHEFVVEIEQLGARLARLTEGERLKWEKASAALPAFCEDWNRMLHDREVNNLSHLTWHRRQGYQTATYTAYGKVQGCQAKESEEGVPIGKVSYQQMSYYLAGRSINDARAHPKLLGTTNTLEIFSWEKDRWFY
jgi:hypothetical protein